MVRTWSGRGRRLLTLVAALYAVFLVVAPFEHHDLLCHLKTPQHCTSCSSSALSSNPEAPHALTAQQLSDAGSVLAVPPAAISVLLVSQLTGRSPPSHS